VRDALQSINEACRDLRPVIAFSGGKDSSVLLHLTYTQTAHRPPVVFVDTGLLRPETVEFAKSYAKSLRVDLIVRTPDRTPLQQWQAQGYPILGPLPAAKWMARNKHLGVRLNCTACCRRMKTLPGRKATRELGCNANLTGVRISDDANRRRLMYVHGKSHENKADGLAVVHPLASWTDVMVRRYIRRNDIPTDPVYQAGAGGNGCRCCAGAWRFENNALQACRQEQPDLWRWFLLDCGAMDVLAVVKTGKPLAAVTQAFEELGGREAVLARFPEFFDYAQRTPLKSYAK
jgi:3'-phosphoadenosine 5'-phosphosulfate sulfotransferase (PAPS reductase)/FAD synthetase